MGIEIKKMASGSVSIGGDFGFGSLHVTLNRLPPSGAPAGIYNYTDAEKEKFEQLCQRTIDDFEEFITGVEQRIAEEVK